MFGKHLSAFLSSRDLISLSVMKLYINFSKSSRLAFLRGSWLLFIFVSSSPFFIFYQSLNLLSGTKLELAKFFELNWHQLPFYGWMFEVISSYFVSSREAILLSAIKLYFLIQKFIFNLRYNQGPFTWVQTNVCTYKNLHNSPLRLHGAGGTGQIFERLNVQVCYLLFQVLNLHTQPFKNSSSSVGPV